MNHFDHHRVVTGTLPYIEKRQKHFNFGDLGGHRPNNDDFLHVVGEDADFRLPDPQCARRHRAATLRRGQAAATRMGGTVQIHQRPELLYGLARTDVLDRNELKRARIVFLRTDFVFDLEVFLDVHDPGEDNHRVGIFERRYANVVGHEIANEVEVGDRS